MDTTLQTQRLRLRPFRNEDLDAYAAICGDPEVMRYLGTGVTLNRQDTWRAMAGILGHWQVLGYGMFAMEICEAASSSGAPDTWIRRGGTASSWVGCWAVRGGARGMRWKPRSGVAITRS